MRCRVPIGILAWALSGALLVGCRTAPTKAISPGTKPQATQSPAEIPSNPAAERSLQGRAEAHAHYAAGVIHELKGEPEAALDEFTAAATKDPTDEELILDITSRLLDNRQMEKALGLLQTAAKQPNASGTLYARLGAVYARLDRKEEALAANQMAVKKSPRVLAGYRNLFASYLDNKQPAEALKIVDQAAKQTEATAGFLVGLGGLYLTYAQQFPTQREAVNARALTVLDRAEKLKPTGTHVRLQLADGFFLAGEADRAAKHYLVVLDELADLPQARDLVRDRLTKIYLREGDRKRAVEQLLAGVRDNPGNAQAYYFLGLIAHDEQRWTDMADYMKKAVLFSPNFEPAYYDLAVAQIASGKPDEALATLSTAAEKFRQNFKLEYWRGVANNAAKNHLQAIKHFSAAEMIAQTTDTNLLTQGLYIQMGAAYHRRGDAELARAQFDKALKLRPDSDTASYEVASALIELGSTNDALAILETTKGRFPESFLQQYLFGALASHRKDYAEAVRRYLAAEKLAAANETNRLTHFFYFDLGAAFERSGNHAQAETYFEKSLKLKPDFAAAQNYLGYMWAERGEKLDRARDLIEKAVQTEPKNAAYLDSMGWVLFKQQKPREALEYIARAVQFTEEPDATLYEHLGDIHAALNEPEKAREAWRKSLEIEKNEAVQKKLDALESK